MRSRYSAFVVGDSAYLLASWHTSTRPAVVEPDPATHWLGLRILHAQGGVFDTAGAVEFEATHDRGVHRERSRFLREGGRWFYLDGVTDRPS